MTCMGCGSPFTRAAVGRVRHSGSTHLERHCHNLGFISLVLEGGHTEAGDEGRRCVGPGEFLVHTPFDSHLDRFSPHGADILVLPLPPSLKAHVGAAGRAADADRIARLAERDPTAAAALLVANPLPPAPPCADWPDLLAADLRRNSALSLREWTAAIGLRPETVSRGFRSVYGTTPKAFRANARARRAFAAILTGGSGLSTLAAELGFADQAHMTRAIVALTGRPPGRWRRSAH